MTLLMREQEIWEEAEEKGREEGREEGIRCAVEVLQEAGQTRMFVMNKLAEKYALSQTEAKEKTEQYWK